LHFLPNFRVALRKSGRNLGSFPILPTAFFTTYHGGTPTTGEGMPIGAPADRVRRVLSAAALAGFFAFFGFSPAMAADLRGGDCIEVSGPVDDDVYAAGQEVGVSGAVVGDVIAAGMTVTLPGSVGGSFNAAARTVEVSGEVAGSVRAAGQTVDIQGAIGGDAIAGARTVKLGVQGVVGRDLIVAAQEVELEGRVARRLVGTTGEVTIRGNVAGVEIRADQVILAQGARVDGDLVYTSATKADIQEGRW
jgi:cytoskeletal protein CcmA (bactofilin family)